MSVWNYSLLSHLIKCQFWMIHSYLSISLQVRCCTLGILPPAFHQSAGLDANLSLCHSTCMYSFYEIRTGKILFLWDPNFKILCGRRQQITFIKSTQLGWEQFLTGVWLLHSGLLACLLAHCLKQFSDHFVTCTCRLSLLLLPGAAYFSRTKEVNFVTYTMRRLKYHWY